MLGAVRVPPRRIAGFSSEVLVLGVYTEQGLVLIQPQQHVPNGVNWDK